MPRGLWFLQKNTTSNAVIAVKMAVSIARTGSIKHGHPSRIRKIFELLLGFTGEIPIFASL
jgi:hypothetical protein